MNDIAATAGVSVGSLYQYVSTKDALAELVMQRRSAEIVEFLEQGLPELARLPLREAVSAAVGLTIEAHKKHERLPNLPFTGLPSTGPLAGLRELMQRSAIAFRVYLETRSLELRPQNLDLAVLVLTSAVDAAIHAAMERNAAWLDDGQLAIELVELVLGYLQPREAARSGE